MWKFIHFKVVLLQKGTYGDKNIFIYLKNCFDLFKKGNFYLPFQQNSSCFSFKEYRITIKMETKHLMSTEMSFQSLFH